MTVDDSLSSPRIPVLQLTQQQERLLATLRVRDGRFGSQIADMYLGALVVLSQVDNPERLSQAAQSMRELLEKLPRQLDDAPIQVPRARASERVASISADLQRVRERSKCYDKTARQWKVGEVIDKLLTRLLVRVEEAVDEHLANPKNRDINRHFIKRLGPVVESSDEEWEDELLREWKRLDSYFQSVAHHNISPTPEAFEQEMSACTFFLLERVRVVTTYARFQEIDEAIAEVEGNA